MLHGSYPLSLWLGFCRIIVDELIEALFPCRADPRQGLRALSGGPEAMSLSILASQVNMIFEIDILP